MQFILTLVLAVVAGILYRMGGSENYNTKFRDIGVPTIMMIVMILWGFWHWSLILSWALLFGAMTTYWGFVNPLFKKSKVDKYWWNWLLTGLGYALAMLPIVYVWGLWPGFAIRLFVLPVVTMIWSESFSNDKIEEWGRGFLTIITLYLLWII